MKRLYFLFVIACLLLFALINAGSAPMLAAPHNDPQTVTVVMKDFEFTPKDITIEVGSTVIWKNEGAKKHTATADNGAFNTGTVEPGASSEPLKFDTAGTFSYFCEFHGGSGHVGMSGTITVVAAGGEHDGHGAGTADTAATAEPTGDAAAQAIGKAIFSQKGESLEATTVTISIDKLELPEEGKQYAAWLGNDQKWLSLGKVNLKADNTAQIEFTDPEGASLIEKYNMVLISEQGTALTPAGPIVFSGILPPQTLVHIKHVASKFPDTPANIGLMVGAMEQYNVLSQHVQFMNESIKNNDLPLAKRHLEHIHNLMTGKDGAKDVDLNGQIEVTPPSDGFGIFNYLVGAVQHADLAAKQPDATENVKLKAGHIKITAGNASTTLTQIQALTVQAGAVKSIAELQPFATQITTLNTTALNGTPDSTGAVSPTQGSGGLKLAYDSGFWLATIPLLPGDVTGGKGEPGQQATGGTGGEAAQPTVAPTTAAGGGAATTTVVMKDFEFAPKVITITAGSSVVFVNQGAKKHTATADDNSWNTGIIDAGASSQPIKFDKPGTFPYFCEFHGGAGGTSMAGVIEVK